MKIKSLRLNKLEYNANRDPAIYRRVVGKPFDIQAQIIGSGSVEVSASADGKVCCQRTLTLPGVFQDSITFDSPGTRVLTLVIKGTSETVTRELRLDTLAHAWAG